MKKFIAILLLGFFLHETSNAEIKEAGKDNSLLCTIGALEAYNEGLQYLEKNPKSNPKKSLLLNKFLIILKSTDIPLSVQLLLLTKFFFPDTFFLF